jgi:glycosyltransferase involved in cell wall biosynthesis
VKVLVDAKELSSGATGLARYEREIGARVSRAVPAVVVVRRRAVDDGSAAALSARLVVVPDRWPSVVVEQVVLPTVSWWHRTSTLHALAGRFSRWARPGRRVVTFHEDRATYHARFPPTGAYARWAARVQTAVDRRSLRTADTVLAVSTASATAAVALGAPAHRVRVVHHGVSAAFRQARVRPASGEVVVLASGDPRDDLDYVLDAVAPLGAWLTVTVVGHVPADLARRHRDAAARRGVRLRFVGRIPDAELARRLAGCLCYLHPSTFEGFGLAVVEAMACGAPVVARPSAALQEVAAGCAHTADTAAEATAALRDLLDRPALRTALGSAGRARTERFDWDAAARATAAAYR